MSDSSKTATLSLLQLARAVVQRQEDILRSLEDLLTVMIKFVGAKRGLLLLPDELKELRIHSARNFDQTKVPPTEAWFSRTLAAKAIEDDSVCLVRDVRDDPIFKDVPSLQGARVTTMLAAPIRADGKLLGVLMCHDTVSGSEFLPKDKMILAELAVHGALLIQEHVARAERRRETASVQGAGKLLGNSKKMDELRDQLALAAGSDLTIWLHGETGTGKELAAETLHELSPRAKGPFVTVNAAALPESLADSELFGHVKGAFTGADRDYDGLFERANGGTLFLDEVAELSATLQAKLLRVLESGELRKVGGKQVLRVDVWVICASHKDLEAEVAAGHFREDLLFRLRGVTIELPPLRERREDIMFLFEKFLGAEARKRRRPAPTIPPAVKAELESYPWPGNVRELLMTAKRAVTLAKEKVEARHLQLRKTATASAVEPELTPEEIQKALELESGNVTKAADRLHCTRGKLRRLQEKYGIE